MKLPLLLSFLMVLVPALTLLYILVRERRRRNASLALSAKIAPFFARGESMDEDTLAAELTKELSAPLQVEYLRTLSENETDLPRARALVGKLPAAEFLRNEVRTGKTWPLRTAAATLIGRLRVTSAIDALLAALRDPYEDQGSVKIAAAEALAMFQNADALPIILEELRRADDDASPLIADAVATFGDLAIPGLIEILRARDGTAGRVWAIRILGRIKAQEATTVLLERFSDRDEKIRLAVATAFGEIRERSTVQPLVAALLRDPAAQVRAESAVSVGKIAGEGAMEILVQVLSDPDYATRLRALEALEQFRGNDPAPILRALFDPSPEVRHRAGLALDRVGYVEGRIEHLAQSDEQSDSPEVAFLRSLASVGLLQTLTSYTIHPSPRVRAHLANILGAFGTAVGQQDELTRLLRDENWVVRAAAAEGLGKLRAADAHEALASALSDVRHEVQEEAVRALSSLDASILAGHRAVIEKLSSEGSVFARQAAVLLLARLPGDEATPSIIAATRDPSAMVRRAAVSSLERPRLEDQRVPALVERLQDQHPDVRLAAAAALGGAATQEAFEGLLRSLPGATAAERERITESLASGPRHYVLARVRELLDTPDIDVKLGIVWTLGKLADGAEILASLLSGPDPKVRASAAGALSKIPGVISVEALVRASADPDARVRAASVGGLARLGEGIRAASTAIVNRLQDPDSFIRNRSIVALARIDATAARTMVAKEDLHVSEPARLVALTLLGSKFEVLSVILEQGKLDEIQAFLRTEDASLEKIFREALGLPARVDGSSVPKSANLRETYEEHARSHLDPGRRADALFALLPYTDARATALFADVLVSDPSLDVRTVAAKAMMGRLLDSAARAALVRAASDPCAEVAVPAVEALSRDGSGAEHAERAVVLNALIRRLGASSAEVNDAVEKSIAVLAKGDIGAFVDQALAMPAADVRVASFRIMAQVGPVECAPLLVEAARGSDPVMRAGAITALGRIPTSPSRNAIRGALSDPMPFVRVAAIEAMVLHTASLDDVGLIARDPSPEVRSALAMSLMRLPNAQKVLEGLTKDPDATVRGRALGTLILSDNAAYRQVLLQARLEARAALAQDPRREAMLTKLRRDVHTHVDPQVRASAVHAFVVFESSDRIDLLVSALRDPSAEVRIAALKVSGDADSEAWTRAVRACLADMDVHVREAAQEAFELHTSDGKD